MESPVTESGASEAERVSCEGRASACASPGPAVSAPLGAARWKLLRQVRESPLTSPLPVATPLASLGRATRNYASLGGSESSFSFAGNGLRSAPLLHLSVPSKRRNPLGLGLGWGRGSQR